MSGKGKSKAEAEEEIDCSCYARQRTPSTCPNIKNVTHPLRYYEFTREEMKALEECDRESFYQRCLPFSTFLATTTYAAVKCGHLSASPHWGAWPKVAVAATVGHILGRASSVQSCSKRLRKLPANSYLGNVMRKYHAGDKPPAHPKAK